MFTNGKILCFNFFLSSFNRFANHGVCDNFAFFDTHLIHDRSKSVTTK